MKKIVPDPPVLSLVPPPQPSMLVFEDALIHVSDLLHSAHATAYESADNLHGQQRALGMATTHLIIQAQDLIDLIIDHLQVRPPAAPPANE
ncbi:hypothetical protein PS3A_18750 [Pseudomonas sp. 3A(2025)]